MCDDDLPALNDILAMIEDLGIDVTGHLAAAILRCSTLEAAQEMAEDAILDARDSGYLDRHDRRVDEERYP